MASRVEIGTIVFISMFLYSLVHCNSIPATESTTTMTTLETDSPELSITFYVDWLRSFGYLTGGKNMLFTPETFNEALSDAQRFLGVEPTGELDAAIRELMEKPRCGVADVRNRSNIEYLPTDAPGFRVTRRSESSIEYYDIWHKDIITYRYKNYSPDLKKSEIKESVEEAFQRWSDVTPLTFHEVFDGETPDIEIWFTTGNHQDDSPFDGRGGVLAHAYYPGPGLGGDMHFDEDETFTVKSYRGTNFFFTALHELGHSLGLDHSNNFATVMAPIYRGYNPNVRLHEDDIKAIQRLYGPRPAAPSTAPPTTVAPTTIYIPPICTVDNFDAIIYNDGYLYIFKDFDTWRINGDKKIEVLEGFQRSSRVTAGYTKGDGIIVLLNETHLWEYDSVTHTLKDDSPTILGTLHMPSRIEAAFHLPFTNKTYLYRSKTFWMVDAEQPVIDIYKSSDFAINMSPIDATFSHSDGSVYFVSGAKYSKLNLEFGVMESGYPRDFRKDWLGCPTITTGKGGPGNAASSLDRISMTIITSLLVTFSFRY